MTSFQSVIYILKERQKKSSVYFLTPTYLKKKGNLIYTLPNS
jgi:hypothetical protein